MKIKKLLSIILAMVLCLCSLTVVASAEENIEEPGYNEGFMPTLPPCEDVEISVVYRPLKSFFVIGVSAPDLEGTVLKITYYDGTSEKVKIEKSDNDFSDYVAGKYYIYTSLFNEPELISVGLNSEKIIVDYYDFEEEIEYAGTYTDYKYLYIPSVEDLIYFMSALVRIYNPFD